MTTLLTNWSAAKNIVRLLAYNVAVLLSIQCTQLLHPFNNLFSSCLQCFDTVGCATGRASGL